MTETLTVSGPDTDPAPVPQRLLLVLPSTGEFDSRTYRIATAAIARGHTVTVLARWKAGLEKRKRNTGEHGSDQAGNHGDTSRQRDPSPRTKAALP